MPRKKKSSKKSKKIVKVNKDSHETKRREFARIFFASKEKNAKNCYIQAGYGVKSATANACRMMKHPHVIDELAILSERQQARTEIRADRVLNELYQSAMSDIRDLFDDEGAIKNPKDWPDHIARAVSGIQIEELKEWDEKKREHVFLGYTKKVKLWDKVKSLELLGKHLKLFQDTINVNMFTTNLLVKMEEGRKRTILDE
jgi:phage terminase small subunit